MKQFIIISLFIFIFTSCYKEELRDFGDFQEDYSKENSDDKGIVDDNETKNDNIDNSEHEISLCELVSDSNIYTSPHVEISDFEIELYWEKTIIVSDNDPDNGFYIFFDFSDNLFIKESKTYKIQRDINTLLIHDEVAITEYNHTYVSEKGGYVDYQVSYSIDGEVRVDNFNDYVRIRFNDIICRRLEDYEDIHISGQLYYCFN